MIWNQSSTCSAHGDISAAKLRTVSPPSVRNVISWFICKSLFAQNLVQAPLRLFVEALDEAEVAVVAVLGDGLADHDLEMPLPPRAARLTSADIATVNPDDHRPLGHWQSGMV